MRCPYTALAACVHTEKGKTEAEERCLSYTCWIEVCKILKLQAHSALPQELCLSSTALLSFFPELCKQQGYDGRIERRVEVPKQVELTLVLITTAYGVWFSLPIYQCWSVLCHSLRITCSYTTHKTTTHYSQGRFSSRWLCLCYALFNATCHTTIPSFAVPCSSGAPPCLRGLKWTLPLPGSQHFPDEKGIFSPAWASPGAVRFVSKQAPEVGCTVSLILSGIPQQIDTFPMYSGSFRLHPSLHRLTAHLVTHLKRVNVENLHSAIQ